MVRGVDLGVFQGQMTGSLRRNIHEEGRSLRDHSGTLLTVINQSFQFKY